MQHTAESEAFQILSQAASTLDNPSLRRWKENGGKVVGFFCSMVPEELLMAGSSRSACGRRAVPPPTWRMPTSPT